jgi:fibronectin-binding autotransporter adhesin
LQWYGNNTQDVSGQLLIGNGVAATLDTQGNNVTLAIAFGASGGGSLVKVGSGVLTLAANNTYGGGTTISAGTLLVGTGGTAGSMGFGPVVDNGALVYNSTARHVINGRCGNDPPIRQGGRGVSLRTAPCA